MLQKTALGADQIREIVREEIQRAMKKDPASKKAAIRRGYAFAKGLDPA